MKKGRMITRRRRLYGLTGHLGGKNARLNGLKVKKRYTTNLAIRGRRGTFEGTTKGEEIACPGQACKKGQGSIKKKKKGRKDFSNSKEGNRVTLVLAKNSGGDEKRGGNEKNGDKPYNVFLERDSPGAFEG